jgi:hypothetical protein
MTVLLSVLEELMGSQVAIINESTLVTDAQLTPIIAALQVQVGRDYAPIWGRYVKLTQIPKGGTPPADQWWMTILDNSDQAGALGYHETTSTGKPLGKVFAKDDLDAGSSLSVTISHELLEMLGNPFINLTAIDPNANQLQQLFMHEMCDPCEDDSLGYKINGVLVSDFLYPEWFDPTATVGTQLTFNKTITLPLSLATGGYMSIYNIATNAWIQKTANRQIPSEMKALAAVAKPGTRKHRIAHRHSVWRKSTKI